LHPSIRFQSSSTLSDLRTKSEPTQLVAASFVEGSLKVLADYIGPHKILWATDYPHSDGFFPGAPKMMMDRLEGVSPETKHGIMAGGAMGFYGLI
jgi:predicted TIM-barrel fold metal-dependent hydrolase